MSAQPFDFLPKPDGAPPSLDELLTANGISKPGTLPTPGTASLPVAPPGGSLDDLLAQNSVKPPLPTNMDLVKKVGQGFTGLPSVLGEGLRLAGAKDTGQALIDTGNELTQEIGQTITPEGKAAFNRSVWDSEKGGFGETPIRSMGYAALESLPGTVAMGGAGKLLQVAGKLPVAAEGAANLLAKAGAGEKLQGVAKTLIESGLPYGAAEGLFSGLQNAEQARQQIEAIPHDKLYEQSPVYKEIFDATDSGLSNADRVSQAKTNLSLQAEKDILANTFATTGGISAATGGGMFGMLDRPAANWLKGLGKGAFTEGVLQEAPQSGLEQVWQNLATRSYVDPNQPLSQDVINQTLTGAGAGAIMGGPFGALASRNGQAEAPGPNIPQVPPQAGPNIPQLPPPAPTPGLGGPQIAGLLPGYDYLTSQSNIDRMAGINADAAAADQAARETALNQVAQANRPPMGGMPFPPVGPMPQPAPGAPGAGGARTFASGIPIPELGLPPVSSPPAGGANPPALPAPEVTITQETSNGQGQEGRGQAATQALLEPGAGAKAPAPLPPAQINKDLANASLDDLNALIDEVAAEQEAGAKAPAPTPQAQPTDTKTGQQGQGTDLISSQIEPGTATAVTDTATAAQETSNEPQPLPGPVPGPQPVPGSQGQDQAPQVGQEQAAEAVKRTAFKGNWERELSRIEQERKRLKVEEDFAYDKAVNDQGFSLRAVEEKRKALELQFEDTKAAQLVQLIRDGKVAVNQDGTVKGTQRSILAKYVNQYDDVASLFTPEQQAAITGNPVTTQPQETPNAQQEQEPGAPDGGSGTRPGLRQEGGSATEGGAGVQPGGQGGQAPVQGHEGEKGQVAFPEDIKKKALTHYQVSQSRNKGQATVGRGALKTLEKSHPGITEWAKAEHARQQEAKRPKLIGKNKDGKNLYEDSHGHRSIEESPGILAGETVGVRPTREGVVAELPEHKDEFLTAEEWAAKSETKAPEPETKPAESDERDEIPRPTKAADWIGTYVRWKKSAGMKDKGPMQVSHVRDEVTDKGKLTGMLLLALNGERMHHRSTDFYVVKPPKPLNEQIKENKEPIFNPGDKVEYIPLLGNETEPTLKATVTRVWRDAHGDENIELDTGHKVDIKQAISNNRLKKGWTPEKPLNEQAKDNKLKWEKPKAEDKPNVPKIQSGTSEPPKPAGPVRAAVKFGGYNAKRYSKPWIALVSAWPTGGRPTLTFGEYVGDDNGGEAEIQAMPGQVVRFGQKDYRGNGTENKWGVVNGDGSVREVSMVEAKQAFNDYAQRPKEEAKPPAGPKWEKPSATIRLKWDKPTAKIYLKWDKPYARTLYTRNDLKGLIEQIQNGRVIVFANKQFGPTIHDFPSGHTNHMGMGVFKTSTPEYEAVWDAGGLMERTAEAGIPYTNVQVTRGTFPYDREGVIAKLKAFMGEDPKWGTPEFVLQQTQEQKAIQKERLGMERGIYDVIVERLAETSNDNFENDLTRLVEGGFYSLTKSMQVNGASPVQREAFKVLQARRAQVFETQEFIDTMRALKAKQTKKAEQEQRKADHAEAIKNGLTQAFVKQFGYIEEEEVILPLFKMGWDHALAGGTASNLPRDEIHNENTQGIIRSGYDYAIKWLESPEGQAFKTGKVERIENAGIKLKRARDMRLERIKQLRAEGLGTDEGIRAAMAEVFANTQRADLFPVLADENATPGTTRYIEAVRGLLIPFKEFAGDAFGGGRRRWNYSFEEAIFREIKKDTKAFERLQSMASAYGNFLSNLANSFDGAKTVADAAVRLEGWMDATFGTVAKTYAKSADGGYIKDYFRKVWTLDSFLKGAGQWSQFGQHQKNENQEIAVQRKQPLVRPKLDKITREGLEDWRKGKNVSLEDIKRQFNFAGVTAGEYVTAKQRQDHANYIYDALMDLAFRLDIHPKNISLGGKLHLAIGALGSGKHAAHYQNQHPTEDGKFVQVINITNTRGDGAVAHEWFHALDYAVSALTGGSAETVPQPSHAFMKAFKLFLQQTVAPEEDFRRDFDRFLKGNSVWQRMERAGRLENTKAAINRARDNLNAIANGRPPRDRYAAGNTKTSYYSEALKMDKGQGKRPYWSNNLELLARAGEAWVYDALDGTNDYLVSDWVEDGKVTAPEYRGTPYPMGDERRAFAHAFEEWIKAIEWTDAGPSIPQDKAFTTIAELAKARLAFIDEYETSLPASEKELLNTEKEQKAIQAAEAERLKAEQEAAAAQKLMEDYENLKGQTAPINEDLANASLDDLDALIDEVAAEQQEAKQEDPPQNQQPYGDKVKALADVLFTRLDSRLEWQELFDLADKAFGGTQGEGAYTPKDAYDALELAVVRHLAFSYAYNQKLGPDWKVGERLQYLQDLLARLPTQSKRTQEQQQFQQFSTPPTYGLLMGWIADIQENDVLLEPSAGTGSLLGPVLFRQPRAILANELSPRRAEILEQVPFITRIFHEDGEQLNNILPKDVKPTVVIMNPPFSQTGGRLGDKMDLMAGARHVEQALKRLGEGGRLVALVGRGMSMDASTYKAWWKKIKAGYTVVANIGIDGKNYQKYGTQFDTRLLVIDKKGPTKENPYVQDFDTLDELLRSTRHWAYGRTYPGEQFTDQSGQSREAERGSSGLEPKQPVPGATGAVGAGERAGDTQPGSGTAPGGAGGPAEQAGVAGPKPDLRNQLLGNRGKRGQRPGSKGTPTPEPAGSSGAGAGPGVLPDSGKPDGRGLGEILSEAAGHGVKGADEAIKGLYELFGGKAMKTFPGAIDEATYAKAKPHFQKAFDEFVAAGNSLREFVAYILNAFGTGIKPYLMRFLAEQKDSIAAKDTRQDATESITPTAADVEDGKPKALTDDIFEGYTPTLRIEGAAKHPASLVESAAMATVKAPSITYLPKLPKATIEKALVSDVQLETAAYAGAAHSQFLPDGTRKGFLIGHGTGVGKGRCIAAIIEDNWQQGRKKALWVSKNAPLLNDALRDLNGIGVDAKSRLFNLSSIKAGGAIDRKEGIAFVTYGTLRGGEKEQEGSGKEAQKRVDQIVKWLGKDFDGVLVFDEAHAMANALATKGKRGMKKTSQTAESGMEIQKALPKARIVYVSATAATEVTNLAYMDRLGLWGEGTPFSSKKDFVDQITSGGVAAMELVANNLKAMGLYQAASIAFKSPDPKQTVTYGMITHNVTEEQRDLYDTFAQAWGVVLAHIDQALNLTGTTEEKDDGSVKVLDGRRKANIMGQFWGTNQRFFNAVLTSLMMPSLINSMHDELDQGNSVVIQLTNTNEAAQERQAAKAEQAGIELDDLDVSPKELLIQYVQNSFPTQQYEQYVDEDGKTQVRPVTDAAGNPVHNQEAVALKNALLLKLAQLKAADNPLDQLLQEFGEKNVAEITGRGRRRVFEPQPGGGTKAVWQKLSPKSREADADRFQNGDKKILVFSEAGGTGRSYHADLSANNQTRRIHYLLQPGWRADTAMQGFGRTHRSNQAVAPHYTLMTTDIRGHRRFLSSVARRLDQLGALTRGQRQTASQGIFSAEFNLENDYANRSLWALIQDVDRVSIMPSDDLKLPNGDFITLGLLEDTMGLKLRDKDGNLTQGSVPAITQFMNRLLALPIETQNILFDAFFNRLSQAMEYAKQAGEYDAGLANITADKVTLAKRTQVFKDEQANLAADMLQFELEHAVETRDFDQAMEAIRNRAMQLVGFAKNNRSGRVYAFTKAGNRTDPKTGAVTQQYRRFGAQGEDLVAATDLKKDTYDNLTVEEAAKAWNESLDKLPKTRKSQLFMVSGTVLPLWKRITDPKVMIARVQTDEGERFIGRRIAPHAVDGTLANLGAEGRYSNITPRDVMDAVLKENSTVRLANNWFLRRVRVSNENRIEITGRMSYPEKQALGRDGAIVEVIQYIDRYFVPKGEAGESLLRRIMKVSPVASMSGQEDAPAFSRPTSRHHGTTASALRGHYSSTFGPGIERLQAAGTLNIVQSLDELPAEVRAFVRGDEEGVYWHGQAWIVAGNVSLANANQVLLHELGEHYGLKRMIGEKAYTELQGHISTLYRMGNARVKEAWDSTLREYRDDQGRLLFKEGSEKHLREVIALLGQSNVFGKAQWWRALLSKIKAFLLRIGLGRVVRSLTDADLNALLVASVHHAARMPGQPSVFPATAQASRPAEIFYSELAQQIGQVKATKAPAAQWKAIIAGLKQKGVKQDEIEWSGINEWLDLAKGPVTREQVQAFLEGNGVRVSETSLGNTVLPSEVQSETERRFNAELDRLMENIDIPEGWIETRQNADGSDSWIVYAPNGEEDDFFDDEEEAQDALDKLNSDAAYNARIDASNSIDWGDIESEVEKDLGDEGHTKYDQYQLPGGKNYQELLIKLPFSTGQSDEQIKADGARVTAIIREMMNAWRNHDDKTYARLEAEKKQIVERQKLRERAWNQAFRSAHWDEPNILAHVRFNERTDADGKKVLFIEEIQSDWGQEGKRKGFNGPEYTWRPEEWTGPKKQKLGKETFYTYRHKSGEELEVSDADIPKAGDLLNDPALLKTLALENFQDRQLNGGPGAPGSIPRAPFVTDTKAWVALALKRMIRHAAEIGADRIAWATGEQQNERYDLSKRVKAVTWEAYSADRYFIGFKTFDDRWQQAGEHTAQELPDVVGKDLAEKIVRAAETEWQKPGYNKDNWPQGEFAGGDLKIGGEGMRGFYDSIVPQVANSLLKKFGGGKIDTSIIPAAPMSEQEFEQAARQESNPNVAEVQGFDITPALKDRALQGLPLFRRAPDERLARARAQGFDTSQVWYHGTPVGNDIRAFDLGKIGAKTGTREHAIFLTDNPDVAAAYGYQDEITLEGDNFTAEESYGSILPLYVRGKLYDASGEVGPRYRARQFEDIIARAHKEGYDGVDFGTLVDVPAGTPYGTPAGRIIAMFKPGDIRSVYAEFDPARQGLDDLLFSRPIRTPGRPYSAQQEATLGKFDRGAPPTYFQSAKARLQATRGRWISHIRQALVDRYASFKDVLGSERLWMLGHLSHTAGGAIEAVLRFGAPKLDASGALDIDANKPSMKTIVDMLGPETDDFFKWIAGNRAANINRKADAAERVYNQLKDMIRATKADIQTLQKGIPLQGMSAYAAARVASLRKEVADIKKDVQDLMYGNITTEGRRYINGLNRLIDAKEAEIALLKDPTTQKDKAKQINARNKAMRQMLALAKEAKKAKEIRERFLKPEDIAALMTLNQGQMTDGRNRARVYDEARQKFEALSDAVVRIGVETGTISDAEADRWSQEGFYVPFYRFLEDEAGDNTYGVRGLDSLTGQTAYKQFKGADIPLNDLMTNVVMNWHHILDSALKNQAAREAFDLATGMGIAKAINPAMKKDGDVFVRIGGKRQYFRLDDTPDAKMIAQSLAAMQYKGLNNFAMRLMNRFKRALTFGVTVSPQFKIRNLIRDSIQAMAASQVSTNVAENLWKGWNATHFDSQAYARMIMSGGAFGDSGYLYGGAIDRESILHDIGNDQLLDTKGKWRKLWDKTFGAYQDFGARLENINRAAEFERRLGRGDSLLDAAFSARDQLDFSRHGALSAVYELSQVVPFLNARLQGMDKLGRAMRDPRQRKQFAAVAGTYILAAVALYLAMKDDDDYKELEQWKRDAYHAFKLPGSETMYFIPRPFELGAMAAIAERAVEQGADDKVHGRLFAERLGHILRDNLQFNPTPQLFIPALEVMANKDFYTGRRLENMGMEQLSPSERKRAWTSDTAIGLSKGMDAVLWDKAVFSPIQIEHLVNGYLGWLGAFTLGSLDGIYRLATGAPDKPAMKAQDRPVIGGFMAEGPARNTRYLTEFYENLDAANKAYSDIRHNLTFGRQAEANAIVAENRRSLAWRAQYNRVQDTLSKLNKRAELIQGGNLPGPAKRAALDQINQQRNRLAQRIVEQSHTAF